MTRQGWRFLDSGVGSASFNMALDEAIARSVAAGDAPPTIRLYRWSEEAVSCGWFENPDAMLDLARCALDGIAVVRRPTGGRAVFHGADWSFSICTQVDDPVFGGSIAASYRAVSGVVASALASIGVTASWIPGGGAKRPTVAHAPCFLAPTRFELRSAGRKLTGCAQRRMDNVILHQGVLFIATPQERILPYLRDQPAVRLQAASFDGIDKEHLASLGGAFRDAVAARVGAFDTKASATTGELHLAAMLASTRYTPHAPSLTGEEP